VGREGPLELVRFAPAKNCAKGRSKEALQINRELDNIKAQIIKHYQHLSDREAFVTAEMVRRSALATLCLQRIPIKALAASTRRC
jgi:hypothetical protein